MEEERLIHLLRGLPREQAPGGFTSRVLRRLDEPAPVAGLARPRGWNPQHRSHWPNRRMLATATVAALGASLGLSVGLLQRERSPGALAVTRTAAERSDRAGAPGGRLAAYPSDRALLRAAVASPADGFAGGQREIGLFAASGPRTAAQVRPGELGDIEANGANGGIGGNGANGGFGGIGGIGGIGGNGKRLSSAQAHLLLREMQLERGRLERELQSLRRADRGPGAPPAVLYLGGDENVDLVLSTGRARSQGRPPVERDGGDFNNFL